MVEFILLTVFCAYGVVRLILDVVWLLLKLKYIPLLHKISDAKDFVQSFDDG